MDGVNIGLDASYREQMAKSLGKLLANSYALYTRLQRFHWNVTGARFESLHRFFQEQYEELDPAIDELAERIRTLGAPAPGGLHQLATLTDLPKLTGEPDANAMLKQLLSDHEVLSRQLRKLIPVAEEASDQGTADFLTERLQVHEKTAWMVRSQIEEAPAPVLT